MAIWDALIGLIGGLLESLHSFLEPVFGTDAAWGWAIILLTVLIRLMLLPLAIKQTRSQRAMQRLAPEIKKIQAKHKVDRSLAKTNPEKYREARQKQQEATMGLYKEHGVNPAAGCLPLVAQMPVFIALFQVLRSEQFSDVFSSAHFYFVHDLTGTAATYPWGLDKVGAIVLIALMAFTTFLSSRQMMATSATTPEQQQQQKIMMYVMPLILLPLSWSMPVGVLLYWVTTNLWTLGQQTVILRSASHATPTPPAQKAGKTA